MLRRWSAGFSLFILVLLSQPAHATLQCFFYLQQNHTIAERFAKEFLPRIRAEKEPDDSVTSPATADFIVDQVARARRIQPVDQALDFMDALAGVEDVDIPSAAVRASFARPRFNATNEPITFRFFPPEIPRSEIMRQITQNVTSRNYVLRETYDRKRGRQAEMIVEMTLHFGGNRNYPVRVAIMIPNNDRAGPQLALISPLITPELTGRMICVYREPGSGENLVITKWEKGEPKRGAIVSSDVARMPSISRDYSEILADGLWGQAARAFDEKQYGARTPRDLRDLPPSENMYRESILAVYRLRGRLHLYREAREDLADFPYAGILWGDNTLEAGAVMRSMPIMNKATRDSNPTLSFFPPNLKGSEILAALEAKIAAGDFIVRPDGQYPKTMNAVTTLILGGEIYPVTFALAFPESGLDGIVSLVGLRPLIGPGVSNHAIVVFRHTQSNQYLVVTRWEDGKPAAAAAIRPPRN